ncbi:MAG: branched-chain amino acid ABC transporter permease [Anaerolineae bacterium]
MESGARASRKLSEQRQWAYTEPGRRAGYQNVVGLLALILLVVVVGWVEIAQPFGLRFRDFTGGLVTFDTLIRIGIFTIVVVGLNLLMGYAGQISLGQAAFYGLGAYFSAIMTTLATRHGVLPEVSRSWWWPWLAILAGMALTGGFAYLIGKPILRLRGNYLAMATLGVGIVLYSLFREGEELTGGSDGISGIPRLAIGDHFVLWPMERYYFLVWALAILVIIVALNIVNSRIGRALRAIHSSEVAANVFGVDTTRSKLQILVISTMIASLAGSLYAHFQALVAPGPFGFVASVTLVCMAAVGGLASIWGALFGVTFVFVVREVLRARMHALLQGAGGEHELIAYGVILILIMIFMPQGVVQGLTELYRDWRKGGQAVTPLRGRAWSSLRHHFKLRRQA